MNKKILTLVIILITILGGGLFFFYFHKPKEEKIEVKGKVYEGEVVIRMTKEGFLPGEVTIKKGTIVKFVNEDSLGHWPASNLHPSHSLYPEFDPKSLIPPGGQWSFTFEGVGEWGMHDHLSPYITGKITVVE